MRRISIAGSMGIVVRFGLGFTDLRNPSELWASGTFTLALVMISVAPVGVFARDPRTRMSWAGFALLGWASLFVWTSRLQPPQVVVTGGGFGGGSGRLPSYATQPLPPLLTDWVLRRFQPTPPTLSPSIGINIPGTRSFVATARVGASTRTVSTPQSRATARQTQLRSFGQVLHSAEILLLGMLGSILGYLAALRVERQAHDARAPSLIPSGEADRQALSG